MAKRFVVPLLAAGLALFGLPALAADPPPALLTAFQKVCVDHQGDQAGAAAAAKALGLALDPAGPSKDPKGETDEVYATGSGADAWAIVLSHPDIGWKEASITGCAVVAGDPDLTFYNAAVAWPGVQGSPGDDGQRMNFVYRQSAAGRSRLPDGDITPVKAAGELRALIVLHDESETQVVLMTFAGG